LATHGHSGDGAQVNLAKEADFRLGSLTISPSTCEVRPPAGPARRVEPKVMEVLVVMARSPSQTVSRDALVAACWEGRIVSDDAISRTIAKVRQLARDIEPPPFTLDTVPKVGFRLNPGPDAPSTPSASESAPEPEPVAAPGPNPRSSRFWLRVRRHPIALTAIALAAALAYAVLSASILGRPAPAPRGNVDVVLLRTDDADPELKRLAIRLSDTAVRLLTQTGVPTQQAPLTPESALASQAELRVVGAIDRIGESFVVNLQVIDRASGIVLWSAKIERPTTDRGLHEEFGAAAAAVLNCALDEREAAGRPLSQEAFSLFLSACDAGIREQTDMLAPARQLVAAAPDVAGAHAMYALAAVGVMRKSDSEKTIVAFSEDARLAAERALALNPKTPNAYVALALRLGSFQHWRERERHLQNALDLQPDHAPARVAYILLLREVGRLKAAAEFGNRSLRLADTRLMGNVPNIALVNAMIGDGAGLADAERRLEAMPLEVADSVRWTVALWWQDPELTLQHLPGLMAAAGYEGKAECVEFYLRRLIAAKSKPVRGLPRTCDGFDPDWRIRFLARQGDVDGAYALHSEQLPNSRRSTMFLFYPEMNLFRRDPRFMPMMEKMGLLAYWRDSGNWPDFCQEPDLPYDCRTYGADP
jgi:DNA-binding winged helix-turn-helix (wHTH) protein